MTSKREIEHRLDRLDPGHEDRIFVVQIDKSGENHEERSRWYTYGEYEREFGELPESEFTFTINGKRGVR